MAHATYGDKECHNSLGIMWRGGLIDDRKDSKSASPILLSAGQAGPSLRLRSTLESTTTVSTSGTCEFDRALTPSGSKRGDMKLAISYFEAAMRHGSPFEAFYHLVKTQAAQVKIVPASLKPGACSTAFSKFVSGCRNFI